MNDLSIQKIVVLGAGVMGADMAFDFARAGFDVRMVDQNSEILEKGLTRIDADARLFREFGLLTEEPAAIRSRVTPCLSAELAKATEDCDFVMEAVPELLDLKRTLFAQLDELDPRVILGSNTSSLTISDISENLKHPQRVVGVHYFNPAHIIPAVEIHRGRDTLDAVVDATLGLMRAIGKKPVLVRKEVPGFIINRLTGAMRREVDYLLDEGIVTPEDLDTAVRASYGFRLACLGPMEAEDMIGLDTAARASGNIYKVLSNKIEPSPHLLEKVEGGELGVKSGKGWYDYRGKSREEVGLDINRRLLKQLALFAAQEKTGS